MKLKLNEWVRLLKPVYSRGAKRQYSGKVIAIKGNQILIQFSDCLCLYHQDDNVCRDPDSGWVLSTEIFREHLVALE